MLSQIHSATLQGLEAIPVRVEVDAYKSGMQPRFTIVGLPDNAVKESQERMFASVRLNGLSLNNCSIVINLAPADLKKEGSALDLPMIVGVLQACGATNFDRQLVADSMFIGELGLDGSILPVKGALPVSILARKIGIKNLFVPTDNAREAAVVDKLTVYGVNNLRDVVCFLQGTSTLEPTVVNTREEFFSRQAIHDGDFEDVKGQENVKRAFEIAAAGGHNIIKL